MTATHAIAGLMEQIEDEEATAAAVNNVLRLWERKPVKRYLILIWKKGRGGGEWVRLYLGDAYDPPHRAMQAKPHAGCRQ